MLEVMINGVRYLPAPEVEELRRWHREALERVSKLEEYNTQTIKLLAQAREDARAANA